MEIHQADEDGLGGWTWLVTKGCQLVVPPFGPKRYLRQRRRNDRGLRTVVVVKQLAPENLRMETATCETRVALWQNPCQELRHL